MEMVRYLKSIPWSQYFKPWEIAGKPFNARKRMAFYQAEGFLHVAMMNLRRGKAGTPDAVWEVSYYNALSAPEGTWFEQSYALPGSIKSDFGVFLLGARHFQFESAPLSVGTGGVPSAGPIKVEVGADNAYVHAVEVWGERHRAHLDVLTPAGVLLAQSWFHQQREWGINEVRFFLADDGTAFVLALCNSNGFLAFQVVEAIDGVPHMIATYLDALRAPALTRLWAAINEPDADTLRQLVAGDPLLEIIATDAAAMQKVSFGGPWIPDLGPLRGSNPLVSQCLLATIPTWKT